VAVWTGRGASYSWVWWADFLEELCWFDADFLIDPQETAENLGKRDLLLIGGGDAGGLQAALDLDLIRGWVEGGGRLVATCAGAYLLRRWARAEIANVAINPPRRAPQRAWTECEGGIVIHPVRGPVNLESAGGAVLTAPVYGGPIFREPREEGTIVAARYSGVTRGAEWLLADRPDIVEGTPAVLTVRPGKGMVVLSGPHLEHPDTPATHLWLASVLGLEPGVPREGKAPPVTGTDPGGEEVVRRLASVRRRAVTIADMSWRSGEKIWSGERVAGFADAIIPRARALAHWGWSPRGKAGGLLSLLEAAIVGLGARRRPEAWDQGYGALSEAAAILLDAYFASRRAGMEGPPRSHRKPSRLMPEGGFHAPSVSIGRGKEV
jgi:hypothetical protein